MLGKALNISKNHLANNKSQFLSFVKRGAYKPGTEPKVFVNKHTKVIC